MDHLFRRKRVGLLKTLLSLCLIFASFLMIHKLKVADKDVIGLKSARDSPGAGSAWCSGQECAVSFKDNKGVATMRVGNFSPAAPPGAPGDELDAPQRVANTVSNATASAPAATWDVHVMNCSEDAAVRTKDWFKRLDPRFHQFVLHRHCRYFPMLINHPETCRGGDVHLLMVVKSVIEQHDRREAVRQTWGRERTTVDGKKIKTLFLLGSPTSGKDAKNLQKLIQYEDQIYGDILQWDFMDTFFNLTLKEVNFLKWLDIHCGAASSRAEFVFKGDDDVFVNTDNLLDLIGFKVEGRKAASLFVGDTIAKAIPIRNRQSKYYIPKELYDKPYPPYVGGGGFLMSSQLARRLLVVSEDLELYPIDDVFLGMCLQRLRLAPEMHPGFRTFGITKRRVSPMNSEPCFYKDLIVVHKLSAQELLKMWRVVHSQDLVCAKRTSM